MSLGVLNNISAIYAQNDLNSTQASLQTVLEQLSSGSRINSGADDAAGLSIANGLAANQAALTQSSTNATDGVGLLQVADGALSQINSLLNRAITLATEAGNGTLDSQQNAAAEQEYGDILSEINTIGSSTVFNGNAVFSTGTTDIFTSDGTSTGTNNYSVGVGSLNTSSGVGVTAPGGATTTTNLAPLQTALSGSGTTYAAAVASKDTLTLAAAAATDTVVGSIELYVGTTAYNISTGTNGETYGALAAQIVSTTGATQGGTYPALTLTAGTAGTAGAITIGTSSLYDTTVGGAIVPTQTTAASNQVAYSAAASETYKLTAANAADTFTDDNLSITNATGTTTSVAFTGTNGVDTAAQLVSNINTALGYTGAVLAGNVITVTASASTTAANFTLNGSVTDLLATPTGSPTAASPGIDLTGTNLNTTTSAATALTDIYAAINDISYQRGAVGANINTLTAVSNVETTQNVNVSSAENSITATDYGAATSNLSKYEILSQTGISALAQANSVQQEVLKLLQ